jgi:hypothetical protein
LITFPSSEWTAASTRTWIILIENMLRRVKKLFICFFLASCHLCFFKLYKIHGITTRDIPIELF